MACVARSLARVPLMLLMAMTALVGCQAASEGGSAPQRKAPTESGDDDEQDTAPPGDESTVTIGGTSDDTDPPGETPGETPGTPSTAPPDEWTGSVPFTSFVPYGPDSCRYSTRFENVTLKLTLREGKVAAATLSAKDVEKLLGCTLSPKPATRASAEHSWSYAPQAATESTFTVKSAAGDKLQTELTVEVGLESDAKGWATVKWKSVDVAAPYDWKVGPQYVALKKK